MERMPNGVTFRIISDEGNTKIIHHDKLKIVCTSPDADPTTSVPPSSSASSSSSSSSAHSDYSPSESSGSDESDDGMDDAPIEGRRYPERVRRNVLIPGAIPWNAVPSGALTLCEEGRDVGEWNVWYL